MTLPGNKEDGEVEELRGTQENCALLRVVMLLKKETAR
jgi:hypothetical protein